ncbi:hypothetical protein Dimus_039026 [Dionaea muscipula]
MDMSTWLDTTPPSFFLSLAQWLALLLVVWTSPIGPLGIKESLESSLTFSFDHLSSSSHLIDRFILFRPTTFFFFFFFFLPHTLSLFHLPPLKLGARSKELGKGLITSRASRFIPFELGILTISSQGPDTIPTIGERPVELRDLLTSSEGMYTPTYPFLS